MWALNTVLWTKNHSAHRHAGLKKRTYFFLFFSIPLFKESTKCTGTASVQELQGAPSAKGTHRHFHESESDNLSTQLMRKNQLCNVLHKCEKSTNEDSTVYQQQRDTMKRRKCTPRES